MTNVDVSGISRGSCSECECREFLAGERVRCATCGHVPNKHSIVSDDTAKNKHTVPRIQSGPKEVDTQDSFRPLTNATFNLIDTNSSITNPFQDNFPLPASPNLVQLDTAYLPAVSGDNRNTDSRGVLRGPCSQCDCEMYQIPTMGVKCSSCAHPPIRHRTGHAPSQPQSLQLSEPFDLLNRIETPSHSKVSAKVDISPVSLQSVTPASPSHHVMTSFRSDPPGVISVSADNSLIVPADQPIKITIEIKVVPTLK